MASTTLTGTTGNDLLNAPGVSQAQLIGLEGADTLNLALGNDLANAGAGNDSIGITRNGAVTSTIFGGKGNDTISIFSATTVGGHLAMGEGNDRFVLTAGNLVGGWVQGNQGSDTISFTATVTNSSVGGGQDNDLITFDTGANLVGTETFGAKGADTITIRSGGANSGLTVQGSEGHDRVNVTGADTFSAASIVAGGKGLDSIVLANQFIATVAGGQGDDTINGIGGFGSGVIFADSNGNTAADAAGGSDLVTTTGGFAGNTTVYGASGADTITFRSGLGQFVIEGGADNDTLASTALFMATAGTISGGTGADTIALGGASANAAVALLGGGGFDSIALGQNTTAGNISINGGAGADTISLATSMITGAVGSVVGGATVNGGDGADSIIIGSTLFSGMEIDAGAVLTSITAASGVLVNYVYGAGDTLQFGTASVIVSTGVNWRTGTPSIYNATGFTGMVSGLVSSIAANLHSGAGSIAVFDSGDDLVMAIRGVASFVSFINVIGGGSLVNSGNGLTTGNFNMNSTNFGFTVATNATNGGMNITFA